jgi:hypothetical protein
MKIFGMVVLALTLATSVSASALAAVPEGPAKCFDSAVRPAMIVVTCGDGNFYFRHIRWSSWTASHASAGGTAYANDCDPYCAAGHFRAYPVRLLLSRPARCADGTLLFRRLRWTFTAAKPSGLARRARMRVTCGMAGH